MPELPDLAVVSDALHAALSGRSIVHAEAPAPLAVRGTRLGIRKGLTLPIVEAELIAEGARLRVAHSDDAREGPLAFLEKRAPVWKAR